MTVESVIRARGILEVLHFTTNHGLGGILATRVVKCRNLLTENQYLEHIYKENCEDRSGDAEWHDYVNLSITRINSRLFGIASENWHKNLDGWWCVLSFVPSILTHDNVVFTTTNNIYTGVQRGTGAEGLDALFAPTVTRWWSNVARRASGTPDNCPTCPQSEVLYPSEVSLQHLQRIYVRNEEHIDDIHAMFGFLSHRTVEVSVNPDAFRHDRH